MFSLTPCILFLAFIYSALYPSVAKAYSSSAILFLFLFSLRSLNLLTCSLAKSSRLLISLISLSEAKSKIAFPLIILFLSRSSTSAILFSIPLFAVLSETPLNLVLRLESSSMSLSIPLISSGALPKEIAFLTSLLPKPLNPAPPINPCTPASQVSCSVKASANLAAVCPTSSVLPYVCCAFSNAV